MGMIAMVIATQYRPVLKGFETLLQLSSVYRGWATQYRPVLKGFETRGGGERVPRACAYAVPPRFEGV